MPNRLRSVRRQRGYSLRRLGPILGCSYETIREWEHGVHRPHPRYVARLEAVLGAKLDYLLAPDSADGPDPKTGAGAVHVTSTAITRSKVHDEA